MSGRARANRSDGAAEAKGWSSESGRELRSESVTSAYTNGQIGVARSLAVSSSTREAGTARVVQPAGASSLKAKIAGVQTSRAHQPSPTEEAKAVRRSFGENGLSAQ